MIVAKEVQYPCKITGIAHIHRIGDRGNGRFGVVFTRLKIIEYHIVAVVSRNKTRNGQSHDVGNQSGSQVAKIPAWN